MQGGGVQAYRLSPRKLPFRLGCHQPCHTLARPHPPRPTETLPRRHLPDPRSRLMPPDAAPLPHWCALPPPSTPAPLQCVANAHDTPLQCLEYSEERDELATCGMGNKVKVWDVKKPSQVRGQGREQQQEGRLGAGDGRCRCREGIILPALHGSICGSCRLLVGLLEQWPCGSGRYRCTSIS